MTTKSMAMMAQQKNLNHPQINLIISLKLHLLHHSHRSLPPAWPPSPAWPSARMAKKLLSTERNRSSVCDG